MTREDIQELKGLEDFIALLGISEMTEEMWLRHQELLQKSKE